MFDHRFDSMISQHCQTFQGLYGPLARELFDRESSGNNERPFHPGEFGVLREVIVDVLLTPFTPVAFSIRSGFVIDGSRTNELRQCDFLVCSRDSTPFLSRLEFGPFYPIEAIAAVGESKSVIRLDRLSDVLQQTQNQLSAIPPREGKFCSPTSRFPSIDEFANEIGKLRFGRVFSFLVCDRFTKRKDFAYSETPSPAIWNDITSMLGKLRDVKCFPHAILSIHDGLLVREDCDSESCSTSIVIRSKESNAHIKFFLAIYYQHLMAWRHAALPIQKYLRVDANDILGMSEPRPNPNSE